jgi:hypothetical protein
LVIPANRIGGKRDFVQEGLFAYRAVITAAGAANAWRIWSRTDAGAAGAWGVPAAADAVYGVRPGLQYSVAVTARCSVERNLLNIRIIMLDATPAVLYYLNTAGQWQAADAAVGYQLSSQWRTIGLNFEAPEDAVSVMWMFSNGTAGAQSIDLDRVWMPMPLWDEGGEELGR